MTKLILARNRPPGETPFEYSRILYGWEQQLRVAARSRQLQHLQRWTAVLELASGEVFVLIGDLQRRAAARNVWREVQPSPMAMARSYFVNSAGRASWKLPFNAVRDSDSEGRVVRLHVFMPSSRGYVPKTHPWEKFADLYNCPASYPGIDNDLAWWTRQNKKISQACSDMRVRMSNPHVCTHV